MLYVQAKAGPSPIHGLGLIAAEFIPAGAVVWRFQPGFDVILSTEDISRLAPAAQKQVQNYAYACPFTRRFILSSDDDRFTNHSDTPNTYFEAGCTRARRNIQPGDEITANYREFDMTLPLCA